MKFLYVLVLFAFSSTIASAQDTPKEPGLLFYLSGDHGFKADYAAGKPDPNYLKDVKIVPGGLWPATLPTYRGATLRGPGMG